MGLLLGEVLRAVMGFMVCDNMRAQYIQETTGIQYIEALFIRVGFMRTHKIRSVLNKVQTMEFIVFSSMV